MHVWIFVTSAHTLTSGYLQIIICVTDIFINYFNLLISSKMLIALAEDMVSHVGCSPLTLHSRNLLLNGIHLEGKSSSM